MGDAPRDRATLRDVARLAGVSEISVSRVMRQAPNISEGMRARVVSAADVLGYTPNRMAGALKTARSDQVAVVVPSMSNAVFPRVIDGIEGVLSEHGLNAVLGITKYDEAREVGVVRQLLSWSPRGLILTGTDADPAIARMVAAQNVPVVQIMDSEGTHIGASVGLCHSAAGRAAADFLLDRGYARPGYLGAWNERPHRSRARRLAFAARLAERGAPLVAHRILEAPSSASLGRWATGALISDHPEIDCIFYANDDLAVGGLLHCMAEGIAVPERLAVLGFNGIDLGRAMPVPLTSIRTPRHEMGARAAQLLIDGTAGPGTQIDLGFGFTDGRSV